MTLWVVWLGFASAACGFVAVAVMIQQRIAASGLADRLSGGIIIDGGTADGVVEETPQHLDGILRDTVANQRPAMVAIIFASVGVVLAFAAALLSLISS